MYALHVAPPHWIGAFRRPSSGGRAASGARWLVAIVCVRLSAITIWTTERHTPQPARVSLAERAGLLEVLLCALLIDLRHRRRRVAYDHVRQDCRAKR